MTDQAVRLTVRNLTGPPIPSDTRQSRQTPHHFPWSRRQTHRQTRQTGQPSDFPPSKEGGV